jgi:hypothetical protein
VSQEAITRWAEDLHRLDDLTASIVAAEAATVPTRTERASLAEKIATEIVLSLPWAFVAVERYGLDEKSPRGVFHTVAFRYCGPDGENRFERRLLDILGPGHSAGRPVSVLHPKPGWLEATNSDKGTIEVLFFALPPDVKNHLVTEFVRVRMEAERALKVQEGLVAEGQRRAEELRQILSALTRAEQPGLLQSPKNGAPF